MQAFLLFLLTFVAWGARVDTIWARTRIARSSKIEAINTSTFVELSMGTLADTSSYCCCSERALKDCGPDQIPRGKLCCSLGALPCVLTSTYPTAFCDSKPCDLHADETYDRAVQEHLVSIAGSPSKKQNSMALKDLTSQEFLDWVSKQHTFKATSASGKRSFPVFEISGRWYMYDRRITKSQAQFYQLIGRHGVRVAAVVWLPKASVGIMQLIRHFALGQYDWSKPPRFPVLDHAQLSQARNDAACLCRLGYNSPDPQFMLETGTGKLYAMDFEATMMPTLGGFPATKLGDLIDFLNAALSNIGDTTPITCEAPPSTKGVPCEKVQDCNHCIALKCAWDEQHHECFHVHHYMGYVRKDAAIVLPKHFLVPESIQYRDHSGKQFTAELDPSDFTDKCY